jgi:hypothetical protein
MTRLLSLFAHLCLLRAAPQQLPHSSFLMLLALGGYFLVGLSISLMQQDLGPALLSSAVDLGLLVGLARLALWITNKGARAVQTVTALAGTGTLFELMAWPLITLLQTSTQGTSSGLSLLLLLLIVWNIVVIGHILRHALDLAMWLASGIALFYIYTSMRVMSALYIAGS